MKAIKNKRGIIMHIDIKISEPTIPSHTPPIEEPSQCARVANRVGDCLRSSAFAISGGICGMTSVFAYEWVRTSGSLSETTPFWIALAGVVGASSGNLAGLLWPIVAPRKCGC